MNKEKNDLKLAGLENLDKSELMQIDGGGFAYDVGAAAKWVVHFQLFGLDFANAYWDWQYSN
jgi:hypothetical protein